jgi:hypothetical protein
MDLLISLLITALIFVLVYYIVMWIVGEISPNPKITKIVRVALLLFALLWLFRVVGFWGGGPYYYYHHV